MTGHIAQACGTTHACTELKQILKRELTEDPEKVQDVSYWRGKCVIVLPEWQKELMRRNSYVS